MTATAPAVNYELATAFCLLAGSTQEVAEILSIVRPEDFAQRKARALVTCAKRVFESGRAIDAGTMVAAAQATSTLADVGGAQELAEIITTKATSTENAAWYAAQVRDAASRRRAKLAIANLGASIADESVPVEESLSSTLTSISRILEADSSRVERIDEMLGRVVTGLGSESTEGPAIVATGIRAFDDLFGGIPHGLVVVGARPGVGKSSFCVQVARHVARESNVLYVSLEMTSREIVNVLVAQESGVSAQRISASRGLALRDEEADAILNACNVMQNLNLLVTCPVRSSLGMIRALAMQQKLRTGLGLVVVDFLQRIKPDTVSRSESRERDVAEIAQGLAELAKELNVPVLCPAAINRAMVAGHRKPTAADLRESGMIESEAHMVIMLHRPEVTEAAAEGEPNDPEILVVKHRGGPIGTVPCRFTGASQRWEPLEVRF